MNTKTQNMGGHVRQFVAAVCIVFVTDVIAYPMFARFVPISVPPWIAMRAKQRSSHIRIGMTDTQVWSTLGLTNRGFQAHVEGSGPPEAYPANYVLWPGYVLHMRWNLHNHPATLVEFKFQDRL